jgi:uridylate kinase
LKLKTCYGRILLKISGETLAGKNHFGFDFGLLHRLAREVKESQAAGVQTAIVLGGGNIWRGRMAPEMDRVTADYMGMTATVLNALAFQEILKEEDLEPRVLTSFTMQPVAEPYLRARAITYLEEGKVILLAGGTGSPYFTTDTCAALRALEIGADVLLKGTKVDGVYDRDPEKDSSAEKFTTLEYQEVLIRGLGVMDLTAIAMCMDNRLPVVVFDVTREGNLRKILCGETIGTTIKEAL